MGGVRWVCAGPPSLGPHWSHSQCLIWPDHPPPPPLWEEGDRGSCQREGRRENRAARRDSSEGAVSAWTTVAISSRGPADDDDGLKRSHCGGGWCSPGESGSRCQDR